jgi:Tol biopolymer transport system component
MRYFLLLVVLVVAATGCSKMSLAFLDEPQATLQPTGQSLDIFGQVGGTPAVRFETPAYTGLQQNSFTEIGSDFDPNVSPDGKQIVYASTRNSRNSDIYVKKVEGQTVTRLTADGANSIQPTFSPDGSFVAFASDRTGHWDIYVMTADGQKPFQLTNGLSHEVHPSWSPDGSRICYSAHNERSGQWEIWVVEVANPANRKFVANGLFPAWCPSPAVNRIAYQLPRQRGTQLFSIWTADLVNDEARCQTEVISATRDTAAICPSWSPDGTKLTYTTVLVPQSNPGTPGAPQAVKPKRVDRGDDIWVAAVDGTTKVRLTGDGTNNWSPTWAEDGRIYFTSNRSGSDNVWSIKPLDTNIIQATRVRNVRVGSTGGPAPVPGLVGNGSAGNGSFNGAGNSPSGAGWNNSPSNAGGNPAVSTPSTPSAGAVGANTSSSAIPSAVAPPAFSPPAGAAKNPGAAPEASPVASSPLFSPLPQTTPDAVVAPITVPAVK